MRLLAITFLTLSFNFVFSQNNSLLVNSGEVIADGIKYYEDDKFDKAIFKYSQVAEGDTNYVIALYEKGLALMAQKSYESSIEIFKRGVAMESAQHTNFIQELGNAYSYNGQFDKAMETYRLGLLENPNYFRFYYEMGAACYNNKKPKLALIYLDSCLKINFGYGRAHYLMGEICQENNYFIPALMSFQMAAYLSNTDKVGLTSLSEIQKIASGETRVNRKDSIVELFPKDENKFEDLEEIIRSKSELDPKYKVKPEVKLPFTTVIKCLHILNSRLPQYTDSKGWYAENLLPLYVEWWNDKEFNTIMYRMCLSTNKDEAVKMYKKNAELIKQQYAHFFSHFLKKKIIYDSKLPACSGAYKHLFLYDSDNLFVMIPSSESYSLSKGLSPKNGYYIYFYNNGYIKKEGNYVDGMESGTWKYYSETGMLKKEFEVSSPTEYTYTKYYSNGQPQEKGHVKDQKTIDKFYKYFSNGMIDRIIPFNEKEKIDGDVYKYYDNGQLIVIIPFENSTIKDGEQINYYRDGSIYFKENYKDEKTDGNYTEYYRDGKIKITGKFKAGKPDGKWNKFHHNGKLSTEYAYSNGELSGPYKEYYDTGIIESEANYANGDNNGKTIHYDTDGKKFAEYVESKGKIKSATYFDKSGKQIHEVDMARSETPFIKYNQVGIITEEGKALKDNRVGVWKYYNDNGAMYMIKEFDNKGNANGKVEEFFTGGKIKKRYEMQDNKVNGYYIEFYIGGEKHLEGNYVEGNKQGVWKRYYTNGKLSSESYYLNDEIQGGEKSYYLNGNLRSIEEYKEGLFYKYTLFDTSGSQLSTDTISAGYGNLNIKYKKGSTYFIDNYRNYLLDGDQVTYWGNSNIKNKQIRRNGEIINTEYEYYQSGKLKEITFYKYGEIDSTYSTYYENGNLEYLSTYRFGQSNGPEKAFYDNTKIELRGERKDGDKEGWYEFIAPDGNLQYKVLYHLGVVLAYSYYDKDSKPVKEIPFTNASGDFNCTFSNGNPSAKGSYLNGERNGTYTKYYFNGKKNFEATYNAGNLNGKYTYYYENGKVKQEVAYVNGSREGTEKFYDDKGNLTKETTWEGNYKNGPEKIYSGGKLLKTIHYEYDNTYDK